MSRTRVRPGRRAEAFDELFDLVPLLYYRLRAFTQALHGEGEFSGARRSVLRTLTAGPSTVPRLARMRPVARQVMQRLVDELAREELVELVGNPDHRRSWLVCITPLGERRLAQMMASEQSAGRTLLADIGASELETTVQVLRALVERIVVDREGPFRATPAPPARRGAGAASKRKSGPR